MGGAERDDPGEAGRRDEAGPARRRVLRATYAALADGAEWRALPGCPGRSVLRGGPSPVAPEDLVGSDVAVRAFRVEAAPDPVLVAVFEGGGLISYRRPDGRFLHTLNDAEGLARKLAQLGISLGPGGAEEGA